MFKVVGKQDINGEECYVIYDDTDGSFEGVTREFIKRVSIAGLPIAGIHVVDNNGNFTVSEEYFLQVADDEDDEDDWEDDEEDTTSESEETANNDEYVDLNGEYDDDSDDDEDDLWYDDEEDDDSANKEVEEGDAIVDKLYASLSNEQCSLLQRYYLWTSQIIFKGSNMQGIDRLKTKNTAQAKQKIAKIEALRDAGKTWIYAGYYDFRYKEDRFCGLCGQRLRYQHYICDVAYTDVDDLFWTADYTKLDWSKINANIKAGHIFPFGIECTGDFFNIPPEQLKIIKNTQKDVNAELHFMYELMQEPQSYQNAKASFHHFDEIMDSVIKYNTRQKLLNVDGDLSFETPLISFYQQFRDLGLMYPRSLVIRLWHTFMNKSYPYNKHTRLVYVEGERLQELLTAYIKPTLSQFNVDERKMIKDGIANLDCCGYFLRNYVRNLFTYQFMGIYSYMPFMQKGVKGVIDSPRNRDFGGHSSNSKYYFDEITGFDYTCRGKIPEYYANYPYCMNKVSGTGWRKRTEVEFSKEFLAKLLLFQMYKKDAPKSDSTTGIVSEAKPNVITYTVNSDGLRVHSVDAERKVGYSELNEIAAYVRDNLPEEYKTDNKRILCVTDTMVFTDQSGGRKNYNEVFVDNLDAALDFARSTAVRYAEKREAVKLIIEQYQKEKIAELNEKALKAYEARQEELRRYEEQKAKEEEEKRKAAEELAKQKESMAERMQEASERIKEELSNGGVSDDTLNNLVNYNNVSEVDKVLFKNLVKKTVENGYKSLKEVDKTDSALIAIMNVSEVNPELKAMIDAKGSIYYSILETVRRNRNISPKQRYRLLEAMKLVLTHYESMYKVNKKAKKEQPVQPVSETQEAVATENQQVVETTTSPEEVVETVTENITAEPSVTETTAVETVEEQPVAKQEEPVEEQPVVKQEEPVEVKQEEVASAPVKVDDTIDVRKDAEFKNMFNSVLDNFDILRTKMKNSEIIRLVNTIKSIRSKLTATKTEQEIVKSAYERI